jgi:aspartate-semialdehyde dehydrogenase
LVGSEEEASVAILSEQSGEPVVITGVDEETLGSSRAVFFAGTRASSEKALARMGSATPRLIDVTHALEDKPGARLRAPSAEPHGYSVSSTVSVIAHPAAIVLGTFLRRLHAGFPIKRAVVHVFEPVSERGRGGVHELHQQTLDLLSFRTPVKKLFDTQVAFNLVARYGPDAPVPLTAIENRVEKHLASLLALPDPVPMPSLRVIQAPVMHGHSFSVWVEMQVKAATAEISALLAGPEIDLAGEDGAADVIAVAGQSGMTIGPIEPDPNNFRAAWFWIAADNHRVAAENAIAVARAALLEEAAV